LEESFFILGVTNLYGVVSWNISAPSLWV
jgi:hypothetical protein